MLAISITLMQTLGNKSDFDKGAECPVQMGGTVLGAGWGTGKRAGAEACGGSNRHIHQSKMTMVRSSRAYSCVLRDRRTTAQLWVEIWKGFREAAAFDLDLDRSPGPYSQMRRRLCKQKQGGKEGVGSWHVTGVSALGHKAGGGGMGVGEEPGVPSRGAQELGNVCSKR